MAKPKQTSTMTMTSGSVPMKTADGRKYKVRNPTDHDFTETPTLEGVVVGRGHIEVEGSSRVFLVIDGGQILSRVYESKALEDVFKSATEGDHVKLVYMGEKDLGSGRSFKRFNVSLWSE